jgi:hypothetical protein
MNVEDAENALRIDGIVDWNAQEAGDVVRQPSEMITHLSPNVVGEVAVLDAPVV